MKTEHLELVLETPQHLLALMEGRDLDETPFSRPLAEGFREMMTSGEFSPEYLAKLRRAAAADPWSLGFMMVLSVEDLVIGGCGFKGPPTEDGVVEIAYGLAPLYWGRGFATEAAQALVAYALADERVRIIRAHTLPEGKASARVLTKCGFRHVGEVMDPEDGLVWRWEYARTNEGPALHSHGNLSMA